MRLGSGGQKGRLGQLASSRTCQPKDLPHADVLFLRSLQPPEAPSLGGGRMLVIFSCCPNIVTLHNRPGPRAQDGGEPHASGPRPLVQALHAGTPDHHKPANPAFPARHKPECRWCSHPHTPRPPVPDSTSIASDGLEDILETKKKHRKEPAWPDK